MAYCILSCDGGGIRGLIPALLIQQLSSDIPAFLEKVDLFAGTSAGGLVALGLASGVDVDKIVSLFEDDGGQIFLPFSTGLSTLEIEKLRISLQTSALRNSGESWWDWIVEHFQEVLAEIAYVKYSNSGLIQLLRGLLPNVELSRLPRRVLVTTFQLDNPAAKSWVPITISNYPDDPAAATYPVDAGISTAAAPTYFPPYEHPTFGYCVDGGVYANNPGCIAIATALKSGVQLSDIVMLSIGTGANPESVVVNPPPTNYGPLLWMLPLSYQSTPAAPLVSILTDGVASADAFICQQLLGSNYLRLQAPLASSIPLDDYAAVPQLKSATRAFMNSANWTSAETWVKNTW